MTAPAMIAALPSQPSIPFACSVNGPAEISA